MVRSFVGLLVFSSLYLVNTCFAICEPGNTYYIAAILKTEGNVEIWINTRDHWVKNKSLVDSYSAEEEIKVAKITDKLNLCNLAESQYELCKPGRTILEVEGDLLAECVENDRDFQVWAENESGYKN